MVGMATKVCQKNYVHKVVDHHRGEYVKGGYHTNSIEGFWSQLKRGIIGVYHLVTRKHLGCTAMNCIPI